MSFYNYESLKLTDNRSSYYSLLISGIFYALLFIACTIYINKSRLDLSQQYRNELVEYDRSEVTPLLDTR